MTDCAINIKDSSGAYVLQSGLNQKSEEIHFDGEPGDYTLEVAAAFARAEDAESWNFDLTESFRLREPVKLKVMQNGDSTIEAYPDLPASLEVEADASPRTAPEGFVNAGEIELRDAQRGQIRLVVPLRLEN
jgi:hypothetical protein